MDVSPTDSLGFEGSTGGSAGSWGNSGCELTNIGGGSTGSGVGFLKSGNRKDVRKMRFTPVLKRLIENMLSLEVGVAEVVCSMGIGTGAVAYCA